MSLVLIGVLLMTSAEPASSPNLAAMLASESHGWRPDDPDGMYDAETLYKYIDGAAEVYRSFNVRQVLARRYVKEDAPEIIADLFDMGSSKDAFGAYHHDMREGSDAGIGQESEYQGGMLSFWKGRYFVSITALGETDDAKRAVLDLGKAAARAIPDKGAPPDLVQWLPKKGRITSQLHYFHDHPCLNRRYFLTEKNHLALDRETEGILARYKSQTPQKVEGKGSRFVLMLIRYPSAAKAKKSHDAFRAAYLPDADEDGMARTENGKWAGTRLDEDVIIGAFDALSKAEIDAAANEVLRLRSQVQHRKGQPK